MKLRLVLSQATPVLTVCQSDVDYLLEDDDLPEGSQERAEADALRSFTKGLDESGWADVAMLMADRLYDGGAFNNALREALDELRKLLVAA